MESGERDESGGEGAGKLRLNKALAVAGVASRRGADALIFSRRVRVNGVVVTTPGVRIDPKVDVVEVDGRRVRFSAPKVVYLLYKPKNTITTLRDPQGRRTIRDFLRGVSQRVFPVGRLDRNTTGLLLLTNDGELANRLMHPRYGAEKVYEVHLRGSLPPEARRRVEMGVTLEDGFVRPLRVEWIPGGGREETRLRLVLTEGRYRIVRRMFEALGFSVKALHRPQVAFLTLDGLRPGELRPLTPEERERLYHLVGLEPPAADFGVAGGSSASAESRSWAREEIENPGRGKRRGREERG
ncbi:MAG: rRNA pseudouridine synthase [Brockia lithotrophica]|nr:rRNA pseudouridine synthase [Brockia lithotrophica]